MADPTQIMAIRITESSRCSMLEHVVTLATLSTGILYGVCSHPVYVQVKAKARPIRNNEMIIKSKLTCARFQNQTTDALANSFDETSGAFFLSSAKWLCDQS